MAAAAAAAAGSAPEPKTPLLFGGVGSCDGGRSKVGKHTMRSSMYLQGPCPAWRPKRTKVVARLLWAPQFRTCTGLTARGEYLQPATVVALAAAANAKASLGGAWSSCACARRGGDGLVEARAAPRSLAAVVEGLRVRRGGGGGIGMRGGDGRRGGEARREGDATLGGDLRPGEVEVRKE